MKLSVITTLLAFYMLTSCTSNDARQEPAGTDQPAALAGKTTSIEWLDPMTREMGTISEGQDIEISWKMKNTGNQPLVIENVSAGCGCTIPETPKEPIAPGKEGIIKARFNSQGRAGMNRKEVYVDANTEPGRTVLVFQVEVSPKG